MFNVRYIPIRVATIQKIINESNGMFCYSRKAILVRITYKKSEETLRLNERPHRNPGIKPIQVDLWGLPKREVKGRQHGFTDENFKLK